MTDASLRPKFRLRPRPIATGACECWFCRFLWPLSMWVVGIEAVWILGRLAVRLK